MKVPIRSRTRTEIPQLIIVYVSDYFFFVPSLLPFLRPSLTSLLSKLEWLLIEETESCLLLLEGYWIDSRLP